MSSHEETPLEDRLRIMEKALVEGISDRELAQSAPKQFKISPDQARTDLRELKKRLMAEGDALCQGKQDPQALALAVKRRERIYHEAVKSGDRRIALEAEKDRCRLLGVYPSDRRDYLDALEVNEIDQAIETELARLAEAGEAEPVDPPAPSQRPVAAHSAE